ncbi:MAG: helix-turn-helix transcriptional regulator [Spirochaetaceae bacterium]|nr:helix-turn-helix transcriptional regulator [Spirochaetaceae bacterium]
MTLTIICGAAIALLPLITLLLKNLSTLDVQKADEKMPADNNTAGASMLLHSETSVIELNNGQNTLQEITKRYALTPREAEVLKLTLEGQSAEEMAQNLCITQRTVRAHIGSVLKKTGLKNRLQLISTLLLEKES